MRQILFRGKAIQGGAWVQGGIVHQTDYYGDPCDRYFIIDGTNTQDYDIGYQTEVVPETVGQFIGECDKNKTQIFEGDIVRASEQGEVYEIAYIEHYARFAGRKPGVVFAVFDFEQCEVIGNVYDNPELLELLNERKERKPICVLTDEDDCVETPLFWKPRIVRGQPDYVCPYCGASAGTTIPGQYCAKCGEPVDMAEDSTEDFVKVGTEWEVRNKALARCHNCEYWNGDTTDTEEQFCDAKDEYTVPDGWCTQYVEREAPDNCNDAPQLWKLRLGQGQDGYYCPYCGAKSETILLGPRCAKCGKEIAGLPR